jgi:hypothetical protein
MYYLRARYYDPQTGRFNRADSFSGIISDPITLHKYLYAGANPIYNNDPTGLIWDIISFYGSIALQKSLEGIKAGAQWVAKIKAESWIKVIAVAARASMSGTLNMYFDGRDLPKSTAFTIGFTSGLIGGLVSVYLPSPWNRAGATTEALIQNTLNLLAQEKPITAKDIYWAVGDVIVSVLGDIGIGYLTQLPDVGEKLWMFVGTTVFVEVKSITIGVIRFFDEM